MGFEIFAPHALARACGLAIVERAPLNAVLAGVCAPRFGNKRANVLHGGAYCALGACAAEAAAHGAVEPGQAASAIEYRVQIFRSLIVGNAVRCTARLLNPGRRYLPVEVELENGDGRLCALLTGTFAVVDARGVATAAGELPPPLAPARFDYEESDSWTTFGVRVAEVGEGWASATSAFDPRFADADGALHPAFVAAVADSVTVPACATVKAPDESYTTLEYKVNFLRPIRGGVITARGRVAGKDHRAFVVDIDVTDAAGQLCAKMLTSLAVLR